MSVELLISIISLATTTAVGILTLIINHKISKINNIKEYKENNRHITPFELQFRDEEWLYDLIINKDEFYKYDESSQKRITKWFEKYANTHTLTKLIPVIVEKKEEEQKLAEQKAEKQEDISKGKNEEVFVQVGQRRVKIENQEAIKALLSNTPPIDISMPRARLPKSAQVHLRDYPIGSSTITRTPIITDLEDEFDLEDKKK